MNTVPSVLIVNNQIGAAALIKLYLSKVRRLIDHLRYFIIEESKLAELTKFEFPVPLNNGRVTF